MKILLYILIISTCISFATSCFSADQWGAYLDEPAKEEAVENPEWAKTIALVVFNIIITGVIFFSISGYNGSNLLSWRGILGIIIGIAYLTFSFIYADTLMLTWDYLIKGVAIIIGIVIIVVILSNIVSRKAN